MISVIFNAPVLIAFATILVVYFIYKKVTTPANLPPSLPYLPIVGSLPFLSEIGCLHICLAEKAKRYGNVFAFYAANKHVVVLNGYEAIKEGLCKRSTDFAGRTTMYAEGRFWNPHLRGIGGAQYDDNFRVLKKYTIAVLKKFGFGERAIMESGVQDEANEMIKFIKSKNGKAFDMAPLLHRSALNIIYNLMFGERFDADDETGEYISEGAIYYLKTLHPTFDAFPIFRFLPQFGVLLENIETRSRKWREFFDNKVDECLKDTSGKENFVREFALEAGENFEKTELYYIIKDFINGGTDTSAATILWALILIGNRPAIQERLHKEMELAVTSDRCLDNSDKPHLPFLEATILEVMRLRPIVPLALPHATLCDTQAGGFFIPAKTQVLVNVYSAHMDPTVWPEPHEFRPERFLNDKGEVIKQELVISFSLGKRSCPGEVLARHELFLLLGSLIQKFNILPPEGQTSFPDVPDMGLVNAPKPFDVRLVSRTPFGKEH